MEQEQLEVINGKYFTKTDGDYVPLSQREPTSRVERQVKPIPGVIECVCIGFTYWHIHTKGTPDTDSILSVFREIFEDSHVRIESEYEVNAKYSPADRGVSIKVY